MADLYQLIPEDKRDKIFQAAIKEFVERGYEKASTNQIIQQAQISKGLLFHYFKNKQTLFLATFDRCTGELLEESLPYFQNPPSEFFERLSFFVQAKIRFFMEKPFLYSFYMTSQVEMQKFFPEELAKRHQEQYMFATPYMMEGIDTSKFRPGLDLERTIQLIYLSVEGLRGRWIQNAIQQPDKTRIYVDEVIKEFEDLIEMFRYGVYRP